MEDIQDERGFNQIFKDTPAARIRKQRRCDYMIGQMGKAGLNHTTNILEIGCGTGEAIHYIATQTGANCIGIDLSSKFITSAREYHNRENLQFKVANFNDPGAFQEEMAYGSFNYVIGNGILHHLYYNLDASLLNLLKLLKEGGKIIFIEPNIYNPYVAMIFKIPYLRKKAFLEPDEMAFSAGFIKGKLKKANFVNCRTEVRDFLLPNVPYEFINPVIKIGGVLEKTPLTYLAQSVFITAEKGVSKKDPF